MKQIARMYVCVCGRERACKTYMYTYTYTYIPKGERETDTGKDIITNNHTAASSQKKKKKKKASKTRQDKTRHIHPTLAHDIAKSSLRVKGYPANMTGMGWDGMGMGT